RLTGTWVTSFDWHLALHPSSFSLQPSAFILYPFPSTSSLCSPMAVVHAFGSKCDGGETTHMKTFPVRCASFVLIGVLALAAAPRTMALIEITPDPVAIHAHGDFKGYIAEEGFVPGQDFK